METKFFKWLNDNTIRCARSLPNFLLSRHSKSAGCSREVIVIGKLSWVPRLMTLGPLTHSAHIVPVPLARSGGTRAARAPRAGTARPEGPCGGCWRSAPPSGPSAIRPVFERVARLSVSQEHSSDVATWACIPDNRASTASFETAGCFLGTN